jgi:hypothetical protein
VSSLFSGGRRIDGRDPEFAEGTRRRERAFARDIGDEQALARDDQPRYRRPRLWLLVAILAVLVIGGYRAVRHTSGPQITKSCSTPALALASPAVSHGDSVEWSGTGPTGGRYVLVLDGTPTQVDSDNRVSVSGGTALSGSFTMSGCLVHSAFDAPKSAGTHTLRLFHRTNGAFQLVAHTALRVS